MHQQNKDFKICCHSFLVHSQPSQYISINGLYSAVILVSGPHKSARYCFQLNYSYASQQYIKSSLFTLNNIPQNLVPVYDYILFKYVNKARMRFQYVIPTNDIKFEGTSLTGNLVMNPRHKISTNRNKYIGKISATLAFCEPDMMSKVEYHHKRSVVWRNFHAFSDLSFTNYGSNSCVSCDLRHHGAHMKSLNKFLKLWTSGNAVL